VRYSDAMCVLALAWQAHRRWRLVAAGNRDEFHARAALPLAHWDSPAGVIAGRDAVGGGTWLGVNEAGRFAVVTNLRGFGAPDPGKASRGALVTDMLNGAEAGDLEGYNPFNLITIDRARATYLTNRPQAVRMDLTPGMNGLSNGVRDALWPKTRQLLAGVSDWLAAGDEAIEPLFAALRDEREPTDERAGQDEREPITSPVFIRNPVYGARCSTVVTVDRDGNGLIAERRFDAAGDLTGETRLAFRWPAED
jgi:uncharacterized protein with NRDE domain